MARKKLLAILAAMTMVVNATGSPFTSVSQAASTLKLKNISNNKKVLTVGNTFTIKTNLSSKKVSFSSNKTKIATVSKTGTITAKKVGTCTIKVVGTINGKKYRKKITLKVKAKQSSATSTPTSTATATVTVTATPTVTASTSSSSNTNTDTQATNTATAAPTTSTDTGSTTVTTNTPTSLAPAATNSAQATNQPTQATDAATATATDSTSSSAKPSHTDSTSSSAKPAGTDTTSSSAKPTGTDTTSSSAKPAGTDTTSSSAKPSSTATTTPTTSASPIPSAIATGTVVITNLAFSDDGITLSDENGNTVTSADAANLVVTENNCVVITSPCEITCTGNCSEGQIIVNVDKTAYPEGEVTLTLAGLSLSNSTTSPIYVASIGEECNISVKKGTTNILSDGSNYTNADGDTGVIYSKDDLKIKGKGTLQVTGNCGYGIISKDDLKIYNGAITVTSVDACLKGKDSVKIGDADDLGTEGAYDNLSLQLTSSKSDAIRSNNVVDDTSLASSTGDSDYADGKEGTIVINGGTITIQAYADGIQSAGTLTVNGGDITCTTFQGSNYTASNNTSYNGFSEGNKNKTEASAKGLKAVKTITINNGTITIDSSDDAIHSNDTVTIAGGTLQLASADDGIHADQTLTISDGRITVSKSYEGLEACNITISGGTTHVTSSDDGVNASDGSSTSTNPNGGLGMGGPTGRMPWGGNTGTTTTNSSGTTPTITISGGFLYVDASGDGLDSNGNIAISGGTTIVEGPSNQGNSSIDTDGTYTLTGGTVLAIDAGGMQNEGIPSSGSYITGNFSGSAGTTLAITDESGTVLTYVTLHKSASRLVYSNSNVTVSSCKAYTNANLKNASTDSYGYAAEGTAENGSEITLGTSSNSSGSSQGPWGRY